MEGAPAMESEVHKRLKVQAAWLLVRSGCAAAGVEVRCPIARHRVDAAGYLDPLPRRLAAAGAAGVPGVGWLGAQTLTLARGASAKTVIVECKQSRSDFLCDSRNVDQLLEERERLERVRRVLEERIVKVCEPQLRRSGSCLFADLEEWDFTRSRVASYRGVLNDLRRLDERLHGESKFWTLAHYRLADWLYLAAPAGVIRGREVPPGWGLLEMAPGWEKDAGELRVKAPAPELAGKPEHRQRLLRNIAAATSRRALEAPAAGEELAIAE